MVAVHHFVPTLEAGAVGAHVLEAQRAALARGWRSEVFAQHIHPDWAGRGHAFTDYGASVAAFPDDVVIYHSAIGSPVADWLCDRRPRLLTVDYHNITPPSWFEHWEPGVAYGLAWGRAQLRKLARRSRHGIADSGYNADEMRQAGFRSAAVVPILLDTAAFERDVDAAALARLERAKEEGGADWLFVGRVAPNKCQHDLVKAFAVYRRVYDPAARLWIVGSPSSGRYNDALRAYAAELDLGDSVRITGGVPDGVLAAHYRSADVFVSVSEHEGFLVPLLEAWHHSVPIVAYAAAAVPETLGGAGVLLTDKSAATVAAAVSRVMTDESVRRALAAAGHARLETFALPVTRQRFVDAVEAIVAA